MFIIRGKKALVNEQKAGGIYEKMADRVRQASDDCAVAAIRNQKIAL
ncbi:hypothetical protein [Eubacterium ramulus]